ncbi:hypothetical protein OIV83_003641 [Microbotryomycetes sp. JL201]|nr:hypothetical protein OIV83_003641 [Microbotryomycetes sp. JL201]
MSLYAGIRLQKGAQPSPQTSTAQEALPTPGTASDSAATPASPSGAGKHDTPPAETKATEQDKPAWSAALRFAPTIRKKPAATQAVKPIAAAFSKAFASAEDAGPTAVKTPRIVGNAKPSIHPIGGTSGSSSNAQSSSTQASSSIQHAREPMPSSSTASSVLKAVVPLVDHAQPRSSKRRVIAKPPAMTLDDEDVNGSKPITQEKRTEQRNSKRKKGRRKDDPALQFGDVPYDPSRPCDYAAFKAHVQGLRTQRRLEREQQHRRERSYSGSDSESDSEQQSDTDGRVSTLKKARLFAPPTSYDDPPQSSAAGAGSLPEQSANLDLAPRNETGEEAYLRRLAMSAKPAQPAQQPVQQPPARFSAPSFQPAQALSASAPPFTPHQVPAGTATSELPMAPPPSMPTFFAPPGSEDFPPFEAASVAPESQSSATPPAFGSAILDAQAKAREIAARLSKLNEQNSAQAAPALVQNPRETEALPVPPVSSEPDNRSFADRMMAKFGWEEGKGLGANEAGMTSALAVSRAAAVPNPNSKKGKKAAQAASESLAQAGISAKRATIIDAGREARIASQKAEFGEPSRVVLLTNLCGLDDVDDDLGSEVAEEANKFGVVERCLVYPVPGQVRDDEAVRVFLVMSGLAGGYNAVKQFNGRFFGGRTVKARFYDEKAFQQGDRLL